MANVIIGIHGLGNKPPKQILEHWWLHAIREGLKMHGFKTNTPKFELVYWADITHEQPLNIFVKDPESPFYAAERYVKSPKNFHVENHSIRRKVVDFLNEQINKLFLNADFSLNYSFITNSILRNYFNDLNVYYKEECTIDNAFECKIKELIRNRLLTVLEKYKNDNVILVSHSMGSIVAFDVLSFMAENIKVHTFITMGSPLGLPIVINKIALEQKQRIVGKNHMITPNSVSRHWYNFSDISDNVALNYKLADDFLPNDNGIEPIDFLVTNNYEYKGKRNPHKSYGYLRTKEFSTVLDAFINNQELTLQQLIKQRSTQALGDVKRHSAMYFQRFKQFLHI